MITTVAFLPNGFRVVSGSYDGTIRVWDLETGTMVAGLFERHAWSLTAAVSPDETRVVSCS